MFGTQAAPSAQLCLSYTPAPTFPIFKANSLRRLGSQHAGTSLGELPTGLTSPLWQIPSFPISTPFAGLGCSPVVEHVLSMHEAWGSISRTKKAPTVYVPFFLPPSWTRPRRRKRNGAGVRNEELPLWPPVVWERGVGRASMTSPFRILNKKTTFPGGMLSSPPSRWGIDRQAFCVLRKHHSCTSRGCIWVLPLSDCPHYLPLKGPLDQSRVIKVSCLTLTARPAQLTFQPSTHSAESVSFKIRPLFCSPSSGYPVTHLEVERELLWPG